MPANNVNYEVDKLVNNLGTISDFITAAEKVIYNPDDIDSLDSESLIRLYDSASTRQLKVLELCRKILVATKGDSAYPEEIMALAGFLGTLTTENLGKLQSFIKTNFAN